MCAYGCISRSSSTSLWWWLFLQAPCWSSCSFSRGVHLMAGWFQCRIWQKNPSTAQLCLLSKFNSPKDWTQVQLKLPSCFGQDLQCCCKSWRSMIRWMPLQCTASAAFGVCWLAVSSIGARAWWPGIKYIPFLDVFLVVQKEASVWPTWEKRSFYKLKQ